MKKTFLITLSALLVLSLFSCKSKPEPEAEPKQAPVVEETAEAPVVEEPVVTETPAEVPEAQEDSIDESEIQAQLTQKIEDSRNAAIEAGAEEYAAEQLKQIDALYEELKAKGFDAAAADELIARYQILTNYIKAKKSKQKIDTEDLADYNRSSYDAGMDNLVIVEAAYAANEAMGSEVAKASETAYSNFNTVIITAYKKLAKEERGYALEAKKNADSVKAGVSRKEEYSEATKTFQEGDSLYSMQSPEKAYQRYSKAKETYTTLFNEVSEKRAAAQAAIEAAKRRVAESELFAEQADAKTPITEPMEGIEEEDTVLLEEDEYDDPEEAVIEVPETLDGEEEAEETESADAEEAQEE